MLRPSPARWFRLVCPYADLLRVLATLAASRGVEIASSGDAGWHDAARATLALEGLRAFEERYAAYWPSGDTALPEVAGGVGALAEAALAALECWERDAQGQVAALRECEREIAAAELQLDWLRACQVSGLGSRPLPADRPGFAARVFLLPSGATFPPVDGTLRALLDGQRQRFVVVVGSHASLEESAQRVALVHGRRFVPTGEVGAGPAPERLAVRQLQERLGKRARLLEGLREIDRRHGLARQLGTLGWLRWALENGEGQEGGPAFGWVSGWAERRVAEQLAPRLHEAGCRALVRVTAAPPDRVPPVILDNPRWALPFEALTRLFGTPGSGEVDPSSVLALVAPLLFGYMFGDVGQGLVIACAGLLLGRRYPAARMLVPCGISAMAFGWVFGSVFGMEHLLQPLWLHPVSAPQAVLVPPLLGGALLLLLGMGLDGLAAAWERRLVAWARKEGGLVLGYLALLGLLLPPLGGSFAILWLAWLAWWSVTTYRDGGLQRLAGAFFDLLEQAMRLLLNTLSFARVGAFALAHAGLSLATVQLAEAVPWAPGGIAVLLLGNLVVLGLEGLVVSIQTTRLLLFEFFLRFLRGDGRPLRPLALPRFS